jgi:hypothetical protein
MALLEMVVSNAATIPMHERRCTVTERREAMEALPIDAATNVVWDTTAAPVEEAEKTACENAKCATADAEEEYSWYVHERRGDAQFQDSTKLSDISSKVVML